MARCSTSFFEWSVRISLILWAPARFQARVVDAPVSQVDVLPTLTRLAAAISEYLAEGTSAPMLMIRDGRYKYTCCPGDPEQLFDLRADPDERLNLAPDPAQSKRLASFRARAGPHWDVDAVRDAVLADQHRRRVLSGALRVGRYHSWDWQPRRDAAEEYTRGHLDLTELDVNSRFPRSAPFTPRWK